MIHLKQISIHTIFLLLTTLLILPVGQVHGENTGVGMKNSQANHLLHEKSPYLQQHAYNPVNWYPWGTEALELARKEDKPIFLSIGYSTCHWCHVMAHESFEDQVIADFLNANFVSIKVDREERPGIDQIYMAATRAMTGGGGWPMSLFLLPDTKPFYAGTYFPPQSAHGRPGFMEILQAIHTAWRTDRVTLSLTADQVTAHIQKKTQSGSEEVDAAWLKKGFTQIAESYEPKYGGFGQSPKFPRPVVMDFLLRYYKSTGVTEARDMSLVTLERMAAGGMYDQIGGGFHRYSVDGQWRIPHFEKMLYDQSQLVLQYLSAYQLNGNPLYKQVAVETLDYVLRDMQDKNGGFYSAEDADSENPYNPEEHSEGAYYLWTEEELDGELTQDEATIVKPFYGVQKGGNALHDPQNEFTGCNILYQKYDLVEVARKAGVSEEKAQILLQTAREKLLTKREKRTAPHLDDKIITAWNGLMISAFAKAAVVLGEKRYLVAANRATDFLLGNLIEDGELKRRFRDGEAKYPAGLADYSFLIQGLLDLYHATHDLSRLQQAVKLSQKQIAEFSDEQGGFYDTPESADLLARLKEAYDGAEPSGNSVSVLNFLRLSVLVGNQEWEGIAQKSINSFVAILAKYPPAMPLMLSAMAFQMDKAKQIVIVGTKGDAETELLLHEVHSRYLPNSTLILADSGENQNFLEKELQFLKTATKIAGKATAYVCEDFTCKMPVNTPEELGLLLDGKIVQ
ncbi:MAG TPA: thioredoxin domain-containing protein [Desulfocapsa sulfexigens]|nr:thioredoxin domain-containing protein [Desulfocapsa sulfexigens]